MNLPFRRASHALPPIMAIICCAAAPAALHRSTVDDAQERAISRCIDRAAGGRQWLSTTLHALRAQEGGWIGAEVRNSDGSVDLGPMQVNSWWVVRMAKIIGRTDDEVRRWLRDDPCFNVDAARWIFLSALHDAGDYWKAVGIYHSPTRWRQLRYARSVASIMAARQLKVP